MIIILDLILNILFNDINWSIVVDVVSIIANSILSVIAIVISVFTLLQNSKMIFESNKPCLSIYPKVISFSSPHLYLVFKNFGNSGACIINIEYDKVLDGYLKRQPFKNMKNVFIASNQSYVYPLIFEQNLDNFSNFKITYSYLGKVYSEICSVNFSQYHDVCFTKYHSSEDLKELSEILQEMIIQDI